MSGVLPVWPALTAPLPPIQTDGARVFQQHCQSCHEPATGRAPNRRILAFHPREDVIRSLTSGVMASLAGGLTADDIRAVAVYLTPLESSAAAAAVGTDRMCADSPPIHPGPSDWASLGQDDPARRFQPHPGLGAGDVARLKVKWSFAMSGGGQPTVVGDWLFITNRSGRFYALDAATGCVHWVVSGVGSRTTPMIVRSKVSPSGWATYIGADGRVLRAFDAQTGRELWKSPVLETHPIAMLTGTPTVSGDSIFVPVSSLEEAAGSQPAYPCCSFRGSIVAVSAATGRILWQTHVIDEPLRPTHINAVGTQLQGPAGGGVWSAPTADLKRGLIYVGTGDSYTDAPTTGADAVLAIDMVSGAVRWKRQVTPGDNWVVGCNDREKSTNCPRREGPDYDFGASPVLMTLASGRQILAAGQKSGLVYGFNPDTGALLWTTRVGTGSFLGGVEWGLAFDGRRLYAANADTGELFDEGLRVQGRSLDGWISPGPARPGLSALDPLSGAILWQTPAPVADCHYFGDRSLDFAPGVCVRAQSAAPSAMPGVVFSGTLDGWLRAYDSASGRILWAFSTTATTYDTVNGVRGQPGGGIDGLSTTIADGRVYVMSGFNGGSSTGGNGTNVLLAFSPDGQ